MVVPAKCGTINWDLLSFRNRFCFCHARPRGSNRPTKNENASLLRLLRRLFHHHLEPPCCMDMEPDWLARPDGHGRFRRRTCGSWSRWRGRLRNYSSDLARGKEERTRNQPSGPGQDQSSLANVVDTSALGRMV